MSRQIYRDFDEFADSIRGLAGRFIPTARSAADWWIEAVNVDRIEMQQLQIGGASTFAGDGKPGTLTFGIPMTDPHSIRIDGQGLDDGSFILLKHDQPFTYTGRQITRWAGVTVPIDHFEDMEFDSTAAATQGETRTRTEGWMLESMRRLIVRVCCAEDTIVFVDPAASAAAEEEVLSSAALVLQSSTVATDKHVGRPQVSRSRIIARCLELMDASAGQPMLIGDLCRASQVSERTLRNVFQEYFGVGPMRLLKVRQLREIRAALAAADGGEQTVAKIAARFGVWDFSLFARNYRALYGETPSTTLRSAPQSQLRPHALPKTWIRYAAQRFMDSDEMASGRTDS